MEVPDNAYIVILAGGGGTRLWPKSRQKLPKHLSHILGKKTFLREAFDRVKPLVEKERIYIITRKDQLDFLKKELPEVSESQIVVEPLSRNTAWAMGTASALIHLKDPKAVIAFSAADHIIQDNEKYRADIAVALNIVRDNDYILTIGIRPTFPHTGYGYIKIGQKIKSFGSGKDEVSLFQSDGFKEKPDLATAKSFLATGQYLWNANMYCWSTKTILKAFQQLSPQIYKGLESLIKSKGESLEQVYERAVGDQIDTAISEKAKNIVVIPGDFGWSDVGDWKVVYDIQNKDSDGNVVNSANTIAINSKNCLVEGNGRLIVTIGLEDIVVVDTPDALLVCAKNATQDVKKAVEKLKEEKKQEYL